MSSPVTVASLRAFLQRVAAMVPADTNDARTLEEARAEIARIEGIVMRRLYYHQLQYEAQNEIRRAELGLAETAVPLPEHERIDPATPDIPDAVDYLADTLAGRYRVQFGSTDQQAVWDATVKGSSLDPASVSDTLRDIFVAGDVAVEAAWDPVTLACRPVMWGAEHVRFEAARTDRLDKVTCSHLGWVKDATGDWQVRIINRLFDIAAGPSGIPEARCRTFHDGDVDHLVSQEWLGAPTLPWWPLRARSRHLRELRGESAIRHSAMGHVRRRDAVMQETWLAARFNAHASLAVVGDAAALQAEQGRKVSKDVADAITFPGGTDVSPILLPTDTAPLRLLLDELREATFATFGLVPRQGLPSEAGGRISGYALEILNRKSEGTLQRIRQNLAADIAATAAMMADMAAFWTAGPAWPAVEAPSATLQVDVHLGSGYVVDAVSDRDDHTAGILSRGEVLRRRGYSDDEISRIQRELEDEAAASGGEAQSGLGGMFGATQRAPALDVAP